MIPHPRPSAEVDILSNEGFWCYSYELIKLFLELPDSPFRSLVQRGSYFYFYIFDSSESSQR